MGLLMSKAERSARRQVAIRMGKKKVQQYVGDCRRMAGRYTDMARRALSIGNQAQCDQFICRRIQYDRQATKWDSFLLQMEDLTLRGQMAEAMNGMVGSMRALTKEIQAGVSMKDMNKAISELNVTMEHLGQMEVQMGDAMGNLNFEVGEPQDMTADVRVPDDMRAEVERMRTEIMDELVVSEKVGDTQAGGVMTSPVKNVDNRIREGMERLREMKKKS